jgi:leucyl-tRNA synthetase
MEKMKLNTGVSKLMVLTNTIYEENACTKEQLTILTLLLAPYATQLADRLRERMGHTDDVHFHQRPIANESKIQSQLINLPIQVNGKVR